MNIIENNPYRQLGVYANSSTKERLANLNRLKAFLKVGKLVSFPLDLPQLLPPANRSEESVADAVAKLTLPREQMLYGQFWFLKATPIDEVAFRHIATGDVVSAERIWQKKEDASSLQNRIVCALMKGDYDSALSCANTLYNNVSYVRQLKSEVVGEDGNVKVEDMPLAFLDALSDEVGGRTLLPYLSCATWKKHVEDKAVKPLIESIDNAINEAQKSKGKGSQARYATGTKLCKETKSALTQLKQLLSASDLQYQMIADKLGLAILQCGIDYYNDSDEPNSALKAMKLQGYANSIVVGAMAKDRCQKNVEILQKAVDNLPPAEVYAEDKAIHEELRKYNHLPDKICHAVTLLNNTKPHLQVIKRRLGVSNTYYLRTSTLIVGNALSNIIAEVNAAQSIFEPGENSRDAAIAAILGVGHVKSVLEEAWKATLIMDDFDMENDYRINRYNKNRSILRDLCTQMDVSTSTTRYTPRTSPPQATHRNASPSTSANLSKSSGTPRSSRSVSSDNSNSSSSDSSNGCAIGVLLGALGIAIGAAVGGEGGALAGGFISLWLWTKLVN